MTSVESFLQSGPRKEGWLMKQSKHFRQWRPRWVTLRREAIETCQDFSGTSVSESFALARILRARPVEQNVYGRDNCFVLEYFEGSEAKLAEEKVPCSWSHGDSAEVSYEPPTASGSSTNMGRLARAMKSARGRGDVRDVSFQAKNDAERDDWVKAVMQAVQEDSMASQVARAGAQAASIGKAMDTVAESSAEKSTVKGKAGKGKGKAKGKGSPPEQAKAPGSPDVAESKGSPGGKGKATPPPLPPGSPEEGKGKAKGKGKPAAKAALKNGTAGAGNIAKSAMPFGKKLNLKEVGKSEVTGPTVFDNLMEEREGQGQVTLDIEALKQTFAPKSRASAKKRVVIKKEERTVLTQTQAQNCAIVLRTLPLKREELIQAVESLNPGSEEGKRLENEHIERLEVTLPRPAVLRDLLKLETTGSLDDIRDVEKQLIPLAKLERLTQRIRVLGISTRLEQQQETTMGQLEAVQKVCSELRDSRTLRAVLAAVLVMFNFVNFGNVDRDFARRFDVHSLVQINQFKTPDGPFPNFSGLHWVVIRLLSDGVDITHESLAKDIKTLRLASDVSFTSVQSAIDNLQSEVQFLRQELSGFPEAYGGQPVKPETPKVSPRQEELGKAASPRAGDGDKVQAAQSVDTQPSTFATFNNEEVDVAGVGKHRAGIRHALFSVVRKGYNTLRKQAQPGTDKDSSGSVFIVPVVRPIGAPLPARLYLNGDVEGVNEWRKVRVEVKAPGLLCYMQDDVVGGRREMRYAVLAGAEVVPFADELATLEARAEAAEARPNGFELQNVVLQGQLNSPHRARLWFDADREKDSKRWCIRLQELSTAPGAGFLWVHRGSGIWRWRWVILHCSMDNLTGEVASRVFVWYRTPGEYLRGEEPMGGVRLNARSEVKTFMESESRRKEARASPFGFEVICIEDVEEPKTVEANPRGKPTKGRRGEMQGVVSKPKKSEVATSRTVTKSTFLAASSNAEMDRWVQLIRSNRPGGLPEDAKPDKIAGSPEKKEDLRDIFEFIHEKSEKSEDKKDEDQKGEMCMTSLKSFLSTKETPRYDGFLPRIDEHGDTTSPSNASGGTVVQDAALQRLLTPRGAAVDCETACESTPIACLTPRDAQDNLTPRDSPIACLTPRDSTVMPSPRGQRSSRRQQTRMSLSNLAGDLGDIREHDCDGEENSEYTSDEDDSAGTDSGEDEERQRPAIYQLSKLAQRVEASSFQLNAALNKTTTEARQLLSYFGESVQDASSMLLAKQVQSFLGVIYTFWVLLRNSFNDVEKYREKCFRLGRPDPCQAGEGYNGKWAFSSGQKRKNKNYNVQQQLQAKRQAKMVIQSVVRISMARAYAIGAIEMAVQKALAQFGLQEKPSPPPRKSARTDRVLSELEVQRRKAESLFDENWEKEVQEGMLSARGDQTAMRKRLFEEATPSSVASQHDESQLSFGSPKSRRLSSEYSDDLSSDGSPQSGTASFSGTRAPSFHMGTSASLPSRVNDTVSKKPSFVPKLNLSGQDSVEVPKTIAAMPPMIPKLKLPPQGDGFELGQEKPQEIQVEQEKSLKDIHHTPLTGIVMEGLTLESTSANEADDLDDLIAESLTGVQSAVDADRKQVPRHGAKSSQSAIPIHGQTKAEEQMRTNLARRKLTVEGASKTSDGQQEAAKPPRIVGSLEFRQRRQAFSPADASSTTIQTEVEVERPVQSARMHSELFKQRRTVFSPEEADNTVADDEEKRRPQTARIANPRRISFEEDPNKRERKFKDVKRVWTKRQTSE